MEIDVENNRGSVPEVLYRRFRRKEHAIQLLSGQLLMRNLTYYQEIQDPTRRDSCEGVVAVKTAGLPFSAISKSGGPLLKGTLTKNIEAELKNKSKLYISCFSKVLDVRQKTWGPWLVKIHKPEFVLRSLAASLSEEYAGFSLIWNSVEYKDHLTFSEINSGTEMWRSKRHSYAHEAEFRICLVSEVGTSADEVFKLTFPSFSKSCELVHDR